MRNVIAFWSRSAISGKLAFAFSAVGVVAMLLLVPDIGPGALGLLVPIAVLVGAGFALRAGPIWAKMIGLLLAAVFTFVAMFGSGEYVSGLKHGDRLGPIALIAFAMFTTGLIVTVAGSVNLVQAMLATGYWARTPVAARLAFVGSLYWLAVLVADTFLSANLPGLRPLMVPILFVAMLPAAFLIRGQGLPRRIAGLVLAGASAIATALYWTANADLFTLTGPSWAYPGVPGSDYWTLMPWPPLLIIGILLDVCIVALGILHIAQWPPSKQLRAAS